MMIPGRAEREIEPIRIMRRVLAAISNGVDIGDISTLANSEIVEQIRIMVQGEAKVEPRPGPKTSGAPHGLARVKI
jgi:hypothetical protein